MRNKFQEDQGVVRALNEKEDNDLKTSLLFLHIAELRKLCEDFSIEFKGNKNQLILRLLHFLKTGEQIKEATIPSASRAKRGEIYELAPETLILYGAYKNDLKTRLFFKQLIGNYFHFTAFGIDWINERWHQGNPPTYQNFAAMWKAEFQKRQESPASPKKEWAYINFTQQFLKKDPHATRKELLEAWTKERERQLDIVKSTILAMKQQM